MTKKRLSLVFLFLFMVLAFVTRAQYMDITFTTTNITNGKYSPNHVLSVWVKNSNGQYVRSLMVYAAERKNYLIKWNSNSGGDRINAITGATQSSHKTRTVRWDMKNFASTLVANGNYVLCMEITSNDSQGPYREIPFTLSGSDFTLKPADGSNFTKVQLQYENQAVSVKPVETEQNVVKVYPQVVEATLNAEVNLLSGQKVTFTLFDAMQRELGTKTISLNAGISPVSLTELITGRPKGMYFLVTQTNEYTVSHKILKN